MRFFKNQNDYLLSLENELIRIRDRFPSMRPSQPIKVLEHKSTREFTVAELQSDRLRIGAQACSSHDQAQIRSAENDRQRQEPSSLEKGGK